MQRFYGGSPGDWKRMPMTELMHYVDELPKLEAEEQLAAITSAAIGGGNLKKEEANSILRQLRRTARGRRRAQKASPADLGAIGPRDSRSPGFG